MSNVANSPDSVSTPRIGKKNRMMPSRQKEAAKYIRAPRLVSCLTRLVINRLYYRLVPSFARISRFQRCLLFQIGENSCIVILALQKVILNG